MADFNDRVQEANSDLAKGASTGGNVVSSAKKFGTKIADSVMEVTPKTDLTVADKYGKRAVNFVNELALKTRALADDLFGNFKIIGEAKEVLKDAKDTVNGAMATVREARSQVESYTGLNLSSVGALKDSLQNGAITTIANTTGINKSAIYDSIRISEGIAAGDVNALMDATYRITGIDIGGELRNLQTESAIFGELLGSAVGFGITDIYDELFNRIQTNDRLYGDNIAERSVTDNLYRVIANGDIEMLFKIAQTLPPGMVLSTYPDFAADILARYNLPYGKQDTDYSAELKQLDECFTLIDPEWLHSVGGKYTYYSLGPFLKASRDAIRVFSTHADHGVRMAVNISQKYSKQAPTDIIRQHYPNAYLQ